jgi:hypothetical protein
MRLRSMLFGLCRLLAILLLPVLGKPQCSCERTTRDYLVEKDKHLECDLLYEYVNVYYCGEYQYSYYYYLGYYCNYEGPLRH